MFAGGGAALGTASYGLAAMVVSFLDACCWWAFVFVCCCLLRMLWLVENQRRFGQLKNLLHVGIHESKVLMHFQVAVEHFFLFFSRNFFLLSWNSTSVYFR